VHDIELGEILDSRNYLLEEFTGLFFLDVAVLHDVVKELAPRGILHYE